jgi:hypothetical protein
MSGATLLLLCTGLALLAGLLHGLSAKTSSNAPAPRPKPNGYTICGEWAFNPGDRVRILVAVPEYGTEIGHAATCEAVWPGDDVLYRFKLDGRSGRDSVITFYDTELWQLERIPA